ncbi:TIGR03943 family putative permease subunit [Subtercola vilae]|uniref:TIGR03943 family putative permease subunit n=1 Tax=Subtercola vilae TaxID=2056433 RepID=UPI0013758EEB|nr:TIGR03943 family protein [Subtercola vilae]
MTAGLTVVLVGAAVVALLAVPPSTLTSSTVEQRSLNAAASTLSNVGGGAGSGTGSGAAAGGDTSAYTVKDWSTLIRQGAGPDALAGQTATLVGFVTPDPDDPTNVFYIARFVVTCCAVDAQPVGVAVYEPGWSGTYAKDSWVSATGVFASNPSVLSTATTVLQPTSIQAIAQPTEPYVY